MSDTSKPVDPGTSIDTTSQRVAQPRPLPESIETIADAGFRQQATDAWRAASQLRRLMEQWERWFRQLETTGDADPGLALRIAEAVAVCVRALCGLGVNMPTFQQGSAEELLRRFPRPPNGQLEFPSLRDQRWRINTEALLRREDVLTDQARRNQIHEVIREPDWLDDLDLRRRVGDLLLRTDWESEQNQRLQFIGMMLRSVNWQQDAEYRRQTKCLLRADDWEPLMAELLGFVQLLEIAPSVGFRPPPSRVERTPQGTNEQKPQTHHHRRQGRPVESDLTADQRIYDAWQSGQYKQYADLANELGITEREVATAIDRHRKRLERAGT